MRFVDGFKRRNADRAPRAVNQLHTFGKQAIDSNLTFYWNAVRPTNPFSPKWQLNLEFMFLFPIPKHSRTPNH